LFCSFMLLVSVWWDVSDSLLMRVMSSWPSVFASVARYILRWYLFSVGVVLFIRSFIAFVSVLCMFFINGI
jgi:hypothetical protein